MEKIKYRLVFNRRKKLNKDGKALIQVEATLNKRKLYISTHIFIEPKQWDSRKQQVINHPIAEELNTRLYSFIVELEQIEMSFWRKGIPITLGLLKKSNKTSMGADVSFTKFAYYTTMNSTKKETTKNNLLTTIHRLQEFKSNITFKDINFIFVRDFEHFLQMQHCKTNTIGKHLRQLRTFVNEAINAGYMNLDDYPFRKYSIKYEKTTHLSLTENELTQLSNHVFQSLRMCHVRDAFLFCCYTGLRFSDFSNMKNSCLTYEGEHVWLNIKMIKTNINIKLPIDLLFGGKALTILQKYGTLERLNNIGSNSKVNIYLKRMSSECKINKVLHWHVSRHTFSVQLIEQGVPITTIQRLLGHTSVRTTQVYSEVTATTIVKDLTRIQNGVIGR